MVMQWEEDSPVTGRLYRNYDSLVTWLDGSTVHLQQSVDITELKTARIDELTGLFTRRFGKDRLREAMDRATAKGESISVCLFDINDLKCVNDAYGHAEGDRFIRAVALAVRREFAVSDFGFRLSGDELVAVFHRDAGQVNEAMDRVSESLAQEDKGFDHRAISESASASWKWFRAADPTRATCWTWPTCACTTRSGPTTSRATNSAVTASRRARRTLPLAATPSCPARPSITTRTACTTRWWKAPTTTCTSAT